MAITASTDLSYDTAAYNTLAWFALRPEMYFDDIASVATTPETHNGSSVVFTFNNELAAATTPLSETVDVTPQTMGNTTKTLTLAEYGDSVKTTLFVRATSFIPLNPVVANLVGYAAGLTMDTLARDVLFAGTNVLYAGSATSRVTVAATDKLTSSRIRRVYSDLATANVRPSDGALFRSYIHPQVVYDLKEETGDTGWRVMHNYSRPEAIERGWIGDYEGFSFVQTPRAPLLADAGVGGTVDVYQTLFVGREALAKGYSRAEGLGPLPNVIAGPVTDTLRRFVPLGYLWLGGYMRFREEAIRRVESSSSIGAN